MATKRTTLRSRSGRKLYAVRNERGEFEDIQSYRRAQGQDIKRSSKAERDAAAKKAVKKAKPAKRSGGARKAGAARKSATTRPGKTGTRRGRSGRKS